MDNLFTTFEFFEKVLHQIILGVVQGLTEFLPISSTAHLTVVPSLLGWGDPGLTTIASIQLGSIFAVLIYFRRDLFQIAKGFSLLFLKDRPNNSYSRLAMAILIGNIPIVFCGGLIKLFWVNYEHSFLRSIPFIAFISIVMAIILALSDNSGNKLRELENIGARDGLLIGLSQVLAVIPGVSRSGITISTSLLSGLNRASAARFSFLLGVPAITLAGLVEIKEAFSHFSYSDIVLLLIGILSAAITSWLSIDFLIKYLKRYSMSVFVYYRLFFGIFILIWYYS